MVTIKDIARICNVSPATVSNVMNGKSKKVSNETAALILNTIEQLGYKPNFIAKGLRSNRTKLIGVIAEDVSLFNVPPIISGITKCCEESGYMFLLENLRLYDRWNGSWFDDSEKYNSVFKPAMDEMAAINVDGIIYVAGHSRRISSVKQNPNRPVVVAYSVTEDEKIPTYVIDDEKSAYEMTKHIISLGHKKIGVITGERSNLHTLLRIDGYQRALYEEGLLYDPQIIEYGRWSRESGYELAGNLIDKGVTAIFCFADYIAGGVYDYLEENGLRAGKDVCVAGFDDHECGSYMIPQLATMALPTREIGYEATKKLIEIIESSKEDRELIFGDEADKESLEVKIGCKLIARPSVV